MPIKIIKRAENILIELEKEKSSHNPKKISSDSNLLDQQLSFFQLEDPILSDIRNEIEKLDVNSLTPVVLNFTK